MLFKELDDDRSTVSFNTKATEVGNSRALRRNNASVDDSIEPLREQLGWGFDLPYMMTGFLNEPPRAAIKFKETKSKGNIVDFYNQIWD